MLLDNIGNIGNNVSSEVNHVCNLVSQLMMTSASAAAGVPGLGSPASVTRTSSRVQHLLRKKAISEEVDISTSGNATNGDIDPSDVRLVVWEDPGLNIII